MDLCDLKVTNGDLLPYESENSIQLVGQKDQKNSSNKKSISNSKENISTTLKADSIKTKMEDMHENNENTAQKGGFF